jgi:hypothetical protein
LRPETVVEVSPKPPALLLPRGDDPLARLLEIGRQAHRTGGNPDLPGKIL